MKYSKKINNKDFMELYNMYNFYKVNEGADSDIVYGIVKTLKALKINVTCEPNFYTEDSFIY